MLISVNVESMPSFFDVCLRGFARGVLQLAALRWLSQNQGAHLKEKICLVVSGVQIRQHRPV